MKAKHHRTHQHTRDGTHDGMHDATHDGRARPGPARRAGAVPALACLALLALSAGCGGGLSIGVGLGDDWDEPPEVALVASTEAAGAGDEVRLGAAAVDDYGVDHVRLYRIGDDGSRESMGVDVTEPYAWTVVLPPAASGVVRYLARAVDGAGQSAESPVVEISLR